MTEHNTALQKKIPRISFYIQLAFLLLITIWNPFFPITSGFSKILWQKSKNNKVRYV